MTDVAQAATLPGDVRDELRVLHARREQALQHHQNMIAAERRGRALLQDAEQELRELERQEAVDAAAAAGRIAAGIAAGQSAPELPARPVGWLERREIARDRVAAAHAAHRQLEAGLAASSRAMALATMQQQAAIAALLIGHAEELAVEVEAAERLALHLRNELEALGRVHLATDAPGRPILLRRAMRVLNGRPVNDPDRQKPGTIDLIAPAAKRWREAAVALMTAPEAPLPEIAD
jgi:hypothetical protein